MDPAGPSDLSRRPLPSDRLEETENENESSEEEEVDTVSWDTYLAALKEKQRLDDEGRERIVEGGPRVDWLVGCTAATVLNGSEFVQTVDKVWKAG
jgi:hypothetical protein